MVQRLEIDRIKRTSASQLAMNSILELIWRGALRPGDPLPSQRDLVICMGLSRAALREALSALASLGVLEIAHGRTTFVRKIAPEFLVDSESLFLLLERATLLHTIEVRQMLEVEAIGFAAERAAPENLEELERLLRQIQQAAAREREYRVHAELYEPLVRRDAEEARRCMRRHLGVARDAILEAFPEHEDLPAGALFGRQRP